MVACKNKPGQNKDYQKQDYRLPTSITGTRHNPADNDGIDRIVQPPIGNELYQKGIESLCPTGRYDLYQPIWFYEIMKKLTADEAEKKEKPDTPRQPEYYLN